MNGDVSYKKNYMILNVNIIYLKKMSKIYIYYTYYGEKEEEEYTNCHFYKYLTLMNLWYRFQVHPF